MKKLRVYFERLNLLTTKQREQGADIPLEFQLV